MDTDALGTCKEVTEELAQRCPELRRVRGFYYDIFWGQRTHWWLIAPNGQIIDPTKSQFPDTHGEYEEWVEGQEEPVGLCANCGDYVYASKWAGDPTVCSEKCGIEFARSLM